MKISIIKFLSCWFSRYPHELYLWGLESTLVWWRRPSISRILKGRNSKVSHHKISEATEYDFPMIFRNFQGPNPQRHCYQPTKVLALSEHYKHQDSNISVKYSVKTFVGCQFQRTTRNGNAAMFSAVRAAYSNFIFYVTDWSQQL